MREPKTREESDDAPLAQDPLAFSVAIERAFGVLETEVMELEESPRLPPPEDE